MSVVCDSWCFPEDIYNLPQERESEFDVGKNLTFVSAKQVRECVKDMAQAFVMLVSLEARGKVIVRDLPGVCEFPRVFPEHISDFTLEWKVEFTINLVPGTSPVSMAPYRMPASKSGDLKKHLEELLEKNFVWTSVSLWGAPVLLVNKKDESMRLCVDYR